VTVFIIVCAVMLVAAIAAFAYPLLRPVPVVAKGEPILPAAKVPALVVGAFLIVGAAAMYNHATSFPWQDPRLAAPVPPGHGENMQGDSMEEVTQQLQARLNDNPNDAEGWRMLARTYLVTNRASDAVAAYEKAMAIAGDADPSLKLDLAEAMILTEDPALQGKAKDIVDAALAADSNSQKALWYSGVIALRADDKETARTRWSKLLEQNPPPEIRQILEQQLAALGVAVPAAAQPAGEAVQQSPPATGVQGSEVAGPSPQGRTIRVTVSVDPSLAGKLKPGTTLFVSAREPGIPGPPLAAVRLTTDDLPTTVVLSDANSMMEGRNLSAVNDVEVVARVAFGGTVMSASGDLIGTAIQKKGGPADLSVAIARVQP
jgi:cytochrome c-type biogenesis protein CcmH